MPLVTDKGLPDLLALHDRRLENPGPLLGDYDKLAIADNLLRQMTDPEVAGPQEIRMSALGNCARKLAYSYHGVPRDGREDSGRRRRVFASGDVAEPVIAIGIAEALLAFESKWRLEAFTGERREGGGGGQIVVETVFQVPGEEHPIVSRGHPDGILTYETFDRAVLEVKAKSSWAFLEAEKALSEGRDPFGLDFPETWQSDAYMRALGLDLAYIAFEAKEHQATVGWWRSPWPETAALTQAHIERVVSAVHPEAVPKVLPNGVDLRPEIDLHKTRGTPNKGHGKLGWRCSYCDWFRVCWPGVREEYEKGRMGKTNLVLYAPMPEEVTP